MEKNYKTKKEEMKNEKTAGNAVVFENPEFGKILTLHFYMYCHEAGETLLVWTINFHKICI